MTEDIESLLDELFQCDGAETEGSSSGSPNELLPGLSHIKSFLDAHQQAAVLQSLEAEGWLSPAAATNNQVMCFGQLPKWANELAADIPAHHFPPNVSRRVPLFDQLVINQYRPGEGITPHVDLLRFEDGICILSLGGPAVMRFTPAQQHDLSSMRYGTGRTTMGATAAPAHGAAAATPSADPPTTAAAASLVAASGFFDDSGARDGADVSVMKGGAVAAKVLDTTPSSPAATAAAAATSPCGDSIGHAVLLLPGDLLLLHSEARYCWRHGIDAVVEEVVSTPGSGTVRVVRGHRVSVTLRRVCQSIVLEETEDEEPEGS